MKLTSNSAEEEGKNVWFTLSDQLGELRGFCIALLASALMFLRRSLWILLTMSLIGGVAGYFYETRQQQRYETSMTVSYVHLEKKIYADMITKLNDAIEHASLNAMPGFDSIPETVISSLLEVRATNIKGEPLTEDLSVGKVPFNLLVVVNAVQEVKTIENALVDYLNSPDFVQDRLFFNRESALSQITYHQQIITSLRKQLELLSSQPNSSGAYESILTAITEADSKLQDARAQLRFNQNIEVLHGLQSGSAKPLNQPLRMLLIGAGLGLLFGLAHSFLTGKGLRKENPS